MSEPRGERCITCGDVAVEARVAALAWRSALVERDGVREEVILDLCEGVAVGDRPLCHAGVALARLEDPGAQR